MENSEAAKRDAILPELLGLLGLLGLAVEAVVCLLQQTSKQSLQLLRPAGQNATSVRTLAAVAAFRSGRSGDGGRLTSPGRCWAASPVLGTCCLLVGPRQSGPPLLRASSARLSSLWEDASLYALRSVTWRLLANGQRGAAGIQETS